jgi:hypothetical protein
MFCILIDLKWETFDVALVNPCQRSIKSVAAFSQDWFGLISNSPPLHSTPPAHETPLFLSFWAWILYIRAEVNLLFRSRSIPSCFSVDFIKFNCLSKQVVQYPIHDLSSKFGQ